MPSSRFEPHMSTTLTCRLRLYVRAVLYVLTTSNQNPTRANKKAAEEAAFTNTICRIEHQAMTGRALIVSSDLVTIWRESRASRIVWRKICGYGTPANVISASFDLPPTRTRSPAL